MTNERIGISYQTYFSNLQQVVKLGDLVNGLVKSFCFAVVIGIVSCHQVCKPWVGPAESGARLPRRW